MKNILVFLLFFFSYSCSPISTKIKPSEFIECPPVFFATEHRNYLKSNDKNITIENLAYKAEINNFGYNKPCFEESENYNFSLGVLLIVKPINIISAEISLPVYVALLDSSNTVIEIQYFSVEGEIKKDSDNGKYLETEISKILNLKLASNSLVNSIIIGFMLDKNQKNLLN